MLSSTILLMTVLQPIYSPVALSACSTDAVAQQDTKKVETLKVGDVAPDFTVNKWNGGDLKLSDRKDKVAVVTFWNSLDPANMLVLNHLQELFTKIKADQPVVFMYVNTGDDSPTYSEWMTKNAGKYAGHWGYDPLGQSKTDNISWKWYGATTLPATFVVGTTGRVFAIINGYNTGDARYRDALKGAGIKVD